MNAVEKTLIPVKPYESNNEAVFKTVALPENLSSFKDAIGIGLYGLSIEKYEITKMTTKENLKKVRIELSNKAVEILQNEIEKNKDNFFIQDVIFSALKWVSEQPHIF